MNIYRAINLLNCKFEHNMPAINEKSDMHWMELVCFSTGG